MGGFILNVGIQRLLEAAPQTFELAHGNTFSLSDATHWFSIRITVAACLIAARAAATRVTRPVVALGFGLPVFGIHPVGVRLGGIEIAGGGCGKARRRGAGQHCRNRREGDQGEDGKEA